MIYPWILHFAASMDFINLHYQFKIFTMKNLILFAFLVAINLPAVAQGWLTDLKMAQNIAQNTNKLILVDFWAIWCGPCKTMDAEVWSTAEANALKKNFVPVKIDIDDERSLALKYNVRSIPLLIVMDYKGENIFSYLGYKGKADLMNFISGIPDNAEDLFPYLEKVKSRADENAQTTKEMGIAYQFLAQSSKYEPLKRALLTKSDIWLKKSQKLSKSELDIAEIQLFLAVNSIARNVYKKPLADILANQEKYIGTSNELLMYYVLSQAYLKSGEKDKFAEAYSNLEKLDAEKAYIKRF